MIFVRFGISLAKLRTLHEKANKRQAKAFLVAARKSSNRLDGRASVNKAWSDGAELASVISYLTSK